MLWLTSELVEGGGGGDGMMGRLESAMAGSRRIDVPIRDTECHRPLTYRPVEHEADA